MNFHKFLSVGCIVFCLTIAIAVSNASQDSAPFPVHDPENANWDLAIVLDMKNRLSVSHGYSLILDAIAKWVQKFVSNTRVALTDCSLQFPLVAFSNENSQHKVVNRIDKVWQDIKRGTAEPEQIDFSKCLTQMAEYFKSAKTGNNSSVIFILSTCMMDAVEIDFDRSVLIEFHYALICANDGSSGIKRLEWPNVRDKFETISRFYVHNYTNYNSFVYFLDENFSTGIGYNCFIFEIRNCRFDQQNYSCQYEFTNWKQEASHHKRAKPCSHGHKLKANVSRSCEDGDCNCTDESLSRVFDECHNCSDSVRYGISLNPTCKQGVFKENSGNVSSAKATSMSSREIRRSSKTSNPLSPAQSTPKSDFLTDEKTQMILVVGVALFFIATIVMGGILYRNVCAKRSANVKLTKSKSIFYRRPAEKNSTLDSKQVANSKSSQPSKSAVKKDSSILKARFKSLKLTSALH